MTHRMTFVRAVSDVLMTALATGVLHSLIEMRDADPAVLDVQLRRIRSDSWVSLYAGLTTVLDVHESGGNVWLKAHRTHGRAGGFDLTWFEKRSMASLEAIWPKVQGYATRALAKVDPHHIELEGKVHAAMCAGQASAYRVINREADPSFATGLERADFVQATGARIWDAVTADPNLERWWPGIRYKDNPKRFGTSPDILAIDNAGRLLVIEAKPPSALEGIAWGPAQVAFYGSMFGELFKRNAEASTDITRMLEQRVRLGLTRPGRLDLASPLRIVPVLAIGAGHASYQAIARACLVQNAISAKTKPTLPITRPEIWVLDPVGEPSLVLRS
jgi:hypothetical protein